MMMMMMMYEVIQYTFMRVISNLMPELLHMVADGGQTQCSFINKSETHHKHCIINIFLNLIMLMRQVLISLP
jgi:hypothetical protein